MKTSSKILRILTKIIGKSAQHRIWIQHRKLARFFRGYQISPAIDFVIIGSAKCGTTSLHKYLNLHPKIYLPTGVGINDETGLFLSNSEERIKTTSNRSIRQNLDDDALFEVILTRYRGESIIGEETTDYTKRPYRSVRYDFMKAHNPDMRFIFIVRDPFEKMFSQYRHFLRFQPNMTADDFREELLGYEYYKYSSSYFFQLKPYLQNFGREMIKVVILEELTTANSEVMSDILNFLGVSAMEFPQSRFEKHNVNLQIPDLGISVADVPASIRDFIREDVDKLQAFLGRDLHSIWPSLRQLHSIAGTCST